MQHYATPLVVKSLFTGLLLIVCLPGLLDWQASRLDAQIRRDLLSDNAPAAEAAVARSRYVGWMLDTDSWVWVFNREKDAARKDRLARAFRAATGEDIEIRLNRLSLD